jgi:cytochrome P450
LAKLEGVLALASLAQDVRFEPIDRGRVDLFAGITLRPRRGLRVRVEVLP